MLLVAGLIQPGSAAVAEAATPATPSFSIVTNPPLAPAFDPSNQDYAIRCTGQYSTQITTTGSGSVVVGGRSFRGPVNLYEPLVAGQEAVVTKGGHSYFLRCLPSNFPPYGSTVTGQPQASGYLLDLQPYTVAFDSRGVPVWWYVDNGPFAPWDPKFFDSTTIGWAEPAVGGCPTPGQCSGDYVLRGLDGSLKKIVGGGTVPLDFHDLQQLPNGNYLGIMDVTRNCPAVPSQCVDLSSWGLSSQAAISDNVIVEFNAANQVVWSWSVADHIDVAQANANWRDQYPDVIHMNSIEYAGNGGIIFSARHLDAVYRISMKTGAITWKLGGTPTPQSLAVTGNQYPQLFSGQHDARLDADGTLTVHDNGSRANRPPRALRFSIDSTTMTASIVEQVSDSRAPSSFCCGSVQKLSTGDWVMSWGANDLMTELSPSGVPQLTITYPLRFSYREAPLKASVKALRGGMDAMVPPLVITGDSSPPTTTVTIPANGAVVTGGVWLDAGATDNTGVTNVEFRLTGGGLHNSVVAEAVPTLYGWLAGWSSATVPNGTYTLQSEAYDAAGNSAESAGVTVTVAN